MATPSPILPSDIEDTIPESTGSICTKLNALWSLANKMFTWFDWFENDDGTLSEEAKGFFAGVSVPVGSIVLWPMDTAPDGWLVANGATISRTTYANLFAVYGVKYGAGDGSSTFGIPNLQRRFPFGASGSNVPGSTGGAETVTLTVENLPAHRPELNSDIDAILTVETGSGTDAIDATNTNILRSTAEETFAEIGEDEPVDILNPYFSLHYIIKL